MYEASALDVYRCEAALSGPGNPSQWSS